MEQKDEIKDAIIDKRQCKRVQYQDLMEDIEIGWKFWLKRRYVVCLLAFFGFFSSYLLRVNLSIAIVAMTSSILDEEPEFDWDSKLQGHILSAFFYGYISTQLLGGWLSARIGGKLVFAVGIAVNGLMTLIAPPLVRINVYLFIGLRIIEGISDGVTLPCIHEIWANWAPPLERSKLAAIAVSGGFIGTVFGMSTCGILSQKYGWSTIFYTNGIIALTSAFLWWYFITDKPEDDTRISATELKYIQKSLGQCTNKKISHPWKAIFTSPAVFAIAAAHFGENWGFYTMLTQLPTFMNDVLYFKLEKTGFYSSLPYLAMAISLSVSGPLADYLLSKKILNTTHVRKLFTSGAFIGLTTFMVLTAFVETSEGAVACIIIAVGFSGIAASGFYINPLDIAPQHASVLIGISNTIATLPGIISPIISGYIVQNKDPEEWKIVFIIAGAVTFGGGILFAIFATGERQKWAEETTNVESNAYSNPALDVSIHDSSGYSNPVLDIITQDSNPYNHQTLNVSNHDSNDHGNQSPIIITHI